MKCILIASATVLAGFALAGGAQANDYKVVGPGDCQPYGQSSTYETLAIRADGVQNKTNNTNKYTICPLNRDGESNWTVSDGMQSTVYFVYAGNGTIQCTQTVGTDVAGVDLPATSQTKNAVVAVGALRVIQFDETAGASFQTATITCRLPPLAKLSMITYNEAVETDSAPVI